MAINVARYELNGNAGWGVVAEGGLTPLRGAYPTTGDLVTHGWEEARAVAAAGTDDNIPLNHVHLCSPVTVNQQFVCQGINYTSHMRESRIDPDRQTFNMIFRKASSCLAPADTDIVRPPQVKLLDYEIELGLIMRRPITGPVNVSWANLGDYVAGLVMTNDISARDIQLPQMQFYKGKSYRTFGPTGPWIALLEPEETGLIPKLHLQLAVNGRTRQDAFANDLFYKPPETLTELSCVQDFQPGDLIATGTPGGVAAQAPGRLTMFLASLLPEKKRWDLFIRSNARKPEFLRPGDRIEARIATDDGTLDLGVQRNLIVQG